MQKKYVFISAVALVAVVAAACFFSCDKTEAKRVIKLPKITRVENNEGVAARVNGEVISIDEIRKGYTENPQIAEQVPFNEFYGRAVDVFVNGKLLYQAAVKANVNKLPTYKEQLKTAEEDLARKVYLEKLINEKVNDAAVEKFYQDEYVAKFVSKKEMGAKHILLEDEKTAKDVIAKLNKGGDFDKLAKEYTKDKVVELGYFTEDLMVPEFTKAASALKKGEYTKQPVKTQFGYHIILLEDIRDSAPLPLKEIEPQIKNILSQQVIAETFDNLYKEGKIEKFDLDGKLVEEEKK